MLIMNYIVSFGVAMPSKILNHFAVKAVSFQFVLKVTNHLYYTYTFQLAMHLDRTF